MKRPTAAADFAPRTKPSNYPKPFADRVAGRTKRALGDPFGVKSFGVNLTVLAPGAVSALHHTHAVQDEMVYIVSGHPTLILGEERFAMAPGMVMGFAAGGPAHHLVNETETDVTVLEMGDRGAGDSITYPADDLAAVWTDAGWAFTKKDGTPY
ncbi:MAG: cupin domain-containing protein [Pseudomonadota bacterium]